MKIALLDIDGKLPNLALMKIAAYHKAQGDEVCWYDPFDEYDELYMSKVFTFTPDYPHPILNVMGGIHKGGTGYADDQPLLEEIDRLQPDYSIYPSWPQDTAIGFLTRGCIRKCKWCIVPKKEGRIRPYMDIEEITQHGRFRKAVLYDNNILAAGAYGMEQLKKIIKLGIRVDFNQALDARLVTEENAKLLAQMKWLDHNRIRFGCDTPKQIEECERAISLINGFGFRGEYFLYTMIGGDSDFDESFSRVNYWKKRCIEERVRKGNQVYPFAQPYRDPRSSHHAIPQWQKDLAGWCNKRPIFITCDFKDFEPRVGFKCKEYFN